MNYFINYYVHADVMFSLNINRNIRSKQISSCNICCNSQNTYFPKYYGAILTFFFQENAEETHITQFSLN